MNREVARIATKSPDDSTRDGTGRIPGLLGQWCHELDADEAPESEGATEGDDGGKGDLPSGDVGQ